MKSNNLVIFIRCAYLCKERQGKPNKYPTLSRLLSHICLDISLCQCPRFDEWPRALTKKKEMFEKRSWHRACL